MPLIAWMIGSKPGGPQSQRSGAAERADRHAADVPVDRAEGGMVDAQPVQDARPVVVHDHVVRADQLREDLPAAVRRQVKQQAALVPVVDRETDAAAPAVRDPELVPERRPFDLEHLGTELTEQRRRVRPGDDGAEVQHPQPRQRQLEPAVSGVAAPRRPGRAGRPHRPARRQVPQSRWPRRRRSPGHHRGTRQPDQRRDADAVWINVAHPSAPVTARRTLPRIG